MRAVVFEPTPLKMLAGLASTRLLGRACTGPLVSLREVARGVLPGPRHVRVRCLLTGICGSDLSLLRLKFSMRSATMARRRSLTKAICLGHEAVGEVIEAGPQSRFREGDRVVLIPGVFCESLGKLPCKMCSQGLPMLCFHRDEGSHGIADGGGWSDEFVRHDSQLLTVPAGLTNDQAVLVEPLACAAHAVLRRPPTPDDRIIVIGCGAIGLAIVMALRAVQPSLKIVAIARHVHQGELAARLGTHRVIYWSESIYDDLAAELGTTVLTCGRSNKMLEDGADLVFDAAGTNESLSHALRWTRPRGTVILEGITPAAAPRDASPVWLREVNLIGSHGHGFELADGKRVHTLDLVMHWIEQKRIDPQTLVTHRFPLGNFAEAISTAADKSQSRCVKTLLVPNHA